MPKARQPRAQEDPDDLVEDLEAVSTETDLVVFGSDESFTPGVVLPIGKPPERHDLIPGDMLSRLAILFGRREGDNADTVSLYNHAVGNLRLANQSGGDMRTEHLIEVAYSALTLAEVLADG